MKGILQHYWGFSSFRTPQQGVIQAVLSGSDVLLVMATGAGKSLTYQVPPLVTQGVAIVISPLISLMEDQVAALQARGITAAFLGSAQASASVKEQAWQGAYRLVYMTPELATNAKDRLAMLHKNKRITLVAVDEAHMVSEWGHDFRPEYRYLGQLRDVLPGVPFMALTATATPAVQKDILTNLHMAPTCRKFVLSFERPNLHLSSEKREGGMQHALRGLLQRKREAIAARRPAESTLVYCLSRNQVEEVAAFLSTEERFGSNKVSRYHGQMGVQARRDAHTAFLRDDTEVMVATLAYGMGIDKANVRHIIHWGAPSSLEAYYQQAGRAGRDGEPASCLLLHSAADINLLDTIKDAGQLSAQGRAAYERGLSSIQGYCHGSGCRHAALTHHFTTDNRMAQPASQQPWTPCRGGCDNCDARQANATTTMDLVQWVELLLDAVKAMGGMYGMGKCVQMLRGSNSKDITPRMREMRSAKGVQLHGAGKSKSEEWWKGLVGLLVGRGLLEYQTRGGAGGSSWGGGRFSQGGAQRSYSALCITFNGSEWLRAPPTSLIMDLPKLMHEEEVRTERSRKQQLAAQAALEQRAASNAACDAVVSEYQHLVAELRARRKEVADSLGLPPDGLVTEATLRQIATLRPANMKQLAQVSGMSAAAQTHFGSTLLEVVCKVVAASQHLKHASDWNTVTRAAKDAAKLQSDSRTRPVDNVLAAAARSMCEDPSPAAQRAAAKFQAGLSLAQIAAENERPIQTGTLMTYVAQAAVAGTQIDLARLVLESRLDTSVAMKVADVIAALAAQGPSITLRAVKDAYGDATLEYGHIKLVACLMACRQVLFCDPAAITLQRTDGTNSTTAAGAEFLNDDLDDADEDEERMIEQLVSHHRAATTPARTPNAPTATAAAVAVGSCSGQVPTSGVKVTPSPATVAGLSGAGTWAGPGSCGGCGGTGRLSGAGTWAGVGDNGGVSGGAGASGGGGGSSKAEGAGVVGSVGDAGGGVWRTRKTSNSGNAVQSEQHIAAPQQQHTVVDLTMAGTTESDENMEPVPAPVTADLKVTANTVVAVVATGVSCSGGAGQGQGQMGGQGGHQGEGGVGLTKKRVAPFSLLSMSKPGKRLG